MPGVWNNKNVNAPSYPVGLGGAKIVIYPGRGPRVFNQQLKSKIFNCKNLQAITKF